MREKAYSPIQEENEMEEGLVLDYDNEKYSRFLQFKNPSLTSKYFIFRRESFSIWSYSIVLVIISLSIILRSVPILAFPHVHLVSYRIYLAGCISAVVFGVVPGWLLLLSHIASVYKEFPALFSLSKVLSRCRGIFEILYVVMICLGCGLRLIGKTIAPYCVSDTQQPTLFDLYTQLCNYERQNLAQAEILALVLMPIILQTFAKCPYQYSIFFAWFISMVCTIFSIIYASKYESAYAILVVMAVGAVAYEIERRELDVFVQSRKYMKSQLLANVSIKENVKSNMQAKILRLVVANVSHDLLSPIQALDMGFESLGHIFEDNALALEQLSKTTRDVLRLIDCYGVREKVLESEIKLTMSQKLPRYGLTSIDSSKKSLKERLDTAAAVAATVEMEAAIPDSAEIATVKQKIELLLTTTGSQMHQCNELLQSMRGSLTFMSMIINRTLDVSKIHGNIPLIPNYEFFDYQDSIFRSVKCVLNMQPEVKIEIKPYPVDVDPLVYSDRRWFEGNILCILSNAIKYNTLGQTVMLEASLEEKSTANNPMLRIEVTDCGPPLAAVDRSKFFLQPEQFGRESVGGAGTGLFALSKRIEALKGLVGARARECIKFPEKTGTTVWFAVPFARGSDFYRPFIHSGKLVISDNSSHQSSAGIDPPLDSEEPIVSSRKISNNSTPRSDTFRDIQGALINHFRQFGSERDVIEINTATSDDIHDAALNSPILTPYMRKPGPSTSQRLSSTKGGVIIPTMEERMSGADRLLLANGGINTTCSEGDPTSARSVTPRFMTTNTSTGSPRSACDSIIQEISTPSVRNSSGQPSPAFSFDLIRTFSNPAGATSRGSSALCLPPLNVNTYSPAKPQCSPGILPNLTSNNSFNFNYVAASAVAESQGTCQTDRSIGDSFSGRRGNVSFNLGNNALKSDDIVRKVGSPLADNNSMTTCPNNETASSSNVVISTKVAPLSLSSKEEFPIVTETTTATAKVNPQEEEDKSLRKLFAESSGSSTGRSQRIVLSRSLTVLVVDDSMSIMRIMKMSLERAGNTVHSAVNGKIALDMMMETQFDVVIMDLQMPVMGGLESCIEFRKFETEELHKNKTRTKRQLIIGMSANGEVLTRQAALDADMDEFIAKPFSLNSMLAALRYLDPDMA